MKENNFEEKNSNILEKQKILEFNPSEYRENEFKSEYSEMLTKASSDKVKNREIIDDIMEMENLLSYGIFTDDYDKESLEKLNNLRKKYNLPALKIHYKNEDMGHYISQLEGEAHDNAVISFKKKEWEELKNINGKKDFSNFERNLEDYGLSLEDLGVSKEEIKQIHVQYIKNELNRLKEKSFFGVSFHMNNPSHLRFLLGEYNLTLEDLGMSEEEVNQQYAQYIRKTLEELKNEKTRKSYTAGDLLNITDFKSALEEWHLKFEDLKMTEKEVENIFKENAKKPLLS